MPNESLDAIEAVVSIPVSDSRRAGVRVKADPGDSSLGAFSLAESCGSPSPANSIPSGSSVLGPGPWPVRRTLAIDLDRPEQGPVERHLVPSQPLTLRAAVECQPGGRLSRVGLRPLAMPPGQVFQPRHRPADDRRQRIAAAASLSRRPASNIGRSSARISSISSSSRPLLAALHHDLPDVFGRQDRGHDRVGLVDRSDRRRLAQQAERLEPLRPLPGLALVQQGAELGPLVQ